MRARTLALAAGMIVALATAARATVVSGSFANFNGSPAADRQLHFENRISHDMFIVATGSDGGFSVDLPSGVYDLRAERGAVLKSHIVVGTESLDVGRATDLAPFDIRRPFEHEGVGPVYESSPAPATANLQPHQTETKPTHSTAEAPPPAPAPTR